MTIKAYEINADVSGLSARQNGQKTLVKFGDFTNESLQSALQIGAPDDTVQKFVKSSPFNLGKLRQFIHIVRLSDCSIFTKISNYKVNVDGTISDGKGLSSFRIELDSQRIFELLERNALFNGIFDNKNLDLLAKSYLKSDDSYKESGFLKALSKNIEQYSSDAEFVEYWQSHSKNLFIVESKYLRDFLVLYYNNFPCRADTLCVLSYEFETDAPINLGYDEPFEKHVVNLRTEEEVYVDTFSDVTDDIENNLEEISASLSSTAQTYNALHLIRGRLGYFSSGQAKTLDDALYTIEHNMLKLLDIQTKILKRRGRE